MKSMLRSKERVVKKGFNMRNRMSGEGEKKGRSKGGKEGRCLPLDNMRTAFLKSTY